ncbi:MAG: hypothetical protein VX223_00610 [Myxococcota bacterium]|nr:hypothetical protein [Myxococcota bacterium]
MYYLTFDQDWAPEWASHDIINLLVQYGLLGTFFVTNLCESIDTARQHGFELGLHPNFLPGSTHGRTWDDTLDHMQDLVPDAVGVRSHCLIRGTTLLQKYRERGLLYDASDIFDGRDGMSPFLSWTGVWRVPIWWEDDVAIHRNGLSAFIPTGEPLGIRVINVHPVLHALNAHDLSGYVALKKRLRSEGKALHQASRDDFIPFMQQSGVATWLHGFCEWLARHPSWQGNRLRDAVSDRIR